MTTVITSNFVTAMRTVKELNREFDLISTFIFIPYKGKCITGKYRLALLKLQALVPVAKKFNNGNIWIMGRNTCYKELAHYGFIWNENRHCWMETAKFAVRYETSFNEARNTYVQKITIAKQY